MRIVFIIVAICAVGCLNAQESVNTAGGEATGAEGSVSYSVGQTVYKTAEGSGGSVAQGVQQPYEISIITDVEDRNDIKLSVFPNPTTNFLNLEVADSDVSKLSYEVYDMNGATILSEVINASSVKIDMSQLKASTYFVKLTGDSKELKVFKIIKN